MTATTVRSFYAALPFFVGDSAALFLHRPTFLCMGTVLGYFTPPYLFVWRSVLRSFCTGPPSLFVRAALQICVCICRRELAALGSHGDVLQLDLAGKRGLRQPCDVAV